MAYFFTDEQISKVKEIRPDSAKVESCDKAFIVKDIISQINFDNLWSDEYSLVLCEDARITVNTPCTLKERNLIRKELQKEIEILFNAKEVKVEFVCLCSHEDEPEIIPPLYWGEKETYYDYALSIELFW